MSKIPITKPKALHQKDMSIKNKIGFIVLGICIGITAIFVYFVVKMSNQVNQDSATLQQVVSYLNSQIQAQNQKPTVPTTTPATK